MKGLVDIYMISSVNLFFYIQRQWGDGFAHLIKILPQQAGHPGKQPKGGQVSYIKVVNMIN